MGLYSGSYTTNKIGSMDINLHLQAFEVLPKYALHRRIYKKNNFKMLNKALHYLKELLQHQDLNYEQVK